MSRTRLWSLKLEFQLPNSLKLLISSQCVGTAANLVAAGHEPSVCGCRIWGQGGFTAWRDDLQSFPKEMIPWCCDEKMWRSWMLPPPVQLSWPAACPQFPGHDKELIPGCVCRAGTCQNNLVEVTQLRVLPVSQSPGGFPWLHKKWGGDYIWIILIFPNELEG